MVEKHDGTLPGISEHRRIFKDNQGKKTSSRVKIDTNHFQDFGADVTEMSAKILFF